MDLSFIFVIITVFGVYSYQSRKYSNFIVSLFFILTSGFGFIPNPEVFKLHDLALFMCLIISFFKLLEKGTVFFSAKNDVIAKIIYVLLGYYTVIAIITVMLGRESFDYSIKVWRLELFYLTYFTFRKIPIQTSEKAIKLILVFSAITGVFFILQFLGIKDILSNNISDEITSKDNLLRFRNAPSLLVPLLFFLLYFKGHLKYKYIYLFVFITVVILVQSRGLMVSIIISIVIYQLLIRQYSKLIRMSLLVGALVILFFPLIQYRFMPKSGRGESVGFFEGINKGFIITNNLNKIGGEQDLAGTFEFRMVLASERIHYLFSHPDYLFTGIGVIHEDSPNNRFNFLIGSAKSDEKRYKTTKQEIDTNDISFVTHIFRYGVLYFIIFIVFIIASMKRLYKNRNQSVLSLVAFLLFVEIVTQSLGSDQFSTFTQMALPLLILAQTNFQLKKYASVRVSEVINKKPIAINK